MRLYISSRTIDCYTQMGKLGVHNDALEFRIIIDSSIVFVYCIIIIFLYKILRFS